MSIIGKKSKMVDGDWRVARHGLAVLLLTSIHHVYGAVIYHTPWRYHAVLVSVAAALVMVGALALARVQYGTAVGRVAWWAFALVTLAVPVLTIGAFEGIYNHLVKNVLFFAGASERLMATMFPPPRYEMPNDFWFELTGILQILPAVTAAWLLGRAALENSQGRPPRLSTFQRNHIRAR
jgi:hypothetical protein